MGEDDAAQRGLARIAPPHRPVRAVRMSHDELLLRDHDGYALMLAGPWALNVAPGDRG